MALPNMTEEQARHILRQSIGDYPWAVRSQAAAIATGMQMRSVREQQKGKEG